MYRRQDDIIFSIIYSLLLLYVLRSGQLGKKVDSIWYTVIYIMFSLSILGMVLLLFQKEKKCEENYQEVLEKGDKKKVGFLERCMYKCPTIWTYGGCRDACASRLMENK